MPLGDAPMAVLAAALRASSVVIRYPGQDRHRAGLRVPVVARSGVWSRHGRFYVGTVVAVDPGESGRDLCVIAHRFGYALIYGPAALNTVPVLGYGCNNPLCQRIGPGHVKASSHAGNPLGDPRADPAAVAAEQTRLLRLGLQLPPFDL